MGKITVTEFISIDGVIDSPGGEPGYKHAGWVFRYMTPEQGQFKLDEVLAAEALLIGRVTYESFAGAWPERDGVFADKMNAMPKYVISRTLKSPAWNNSRVLEGDVVEAVRKVKQDVAGEILVAGSRSIVNLLRKHDLVDEYRLMVFSIVLGSGKRLFEETEDALPLKLDKTVPLPNGTTVLSYSPDRSGK